MSVKAGQAVYLKKAEPFTVSYKWVNWLAPLIVVCVILLFITNKLNNPKTLPVNKIRVHGAFINVNESMLHRAIDGVVAGGYFNVDVEKVREVIEGLPWVSQASVRRVWPDTLSVSVTEQKPVAIYKNTGLINANGKVFKPKNNNFPENLPVFEGPASLNKIMLLKYTEMKNLLNVINKKITYFKFDARHALELTLDGDLKIILGQKKIRTRLDRFIKIYPKTIASRVADIKVIDLRYTNGMAIRWKNNFKKINGV